MEEVEVTSRRRRARHSGRCLTLLPADLFLLCLIIGVGVLWQVATGTAQAAPAWLEAESVSDAGDVATAPRAGLDGGGDALAVWLVDGGNTLDALRFSVRPAGGSWAATQDIIAGSFEAPVEIAPASPQISTNDTGGVAAVWQRIDPETSSSSVQAAIGSTAGSWNEPTTISRTFPAENAIDPSIVMDPAGNAGAIWVSDPNPSEPNDEKMRCALWEVANGNGAWTDTYDISPSNEDITASGVYPRVDVNGGGDALAIWVNDNSSEEEDIVRGGYRRAGGLGSCLGFHGGGWTTGDIAAESGNVSDIQLDVDSEGDAVAVWRLGPSGSGGAIRAAIGSTDQNQGWSGPVDLVRTSAPDDAQSPNVGIDDQGNAVAVWRHYNSQAGTGTIQARFWTAIDGTWSPPIDSPPIDIAQVGDHPAAPQIAVNAQGRAVVTWEGGDSHGTVIRAAVGSTDPDGSRTPPETISHRGASLPPRGRNLVALDPAGNAVATWLKAGEMRVAAYDATSPRLDSLNVPRSGVAGVALGFSVSPFDIWSPTETTWSFGDGATATGVVVRHAYAAPGTYQVKVSVTDAVGNTTAEEVPVTIGEPPEPPPEQANTPETEPGPATPTASRPRVAVLRRASMRIMCERHRRRAYRKRKAKVRAKVKQPDGRGRSAGGGQLARSERSAGQHRRAIGSKPLTFSGWPVGSEWLAGGERPGKGKRAGKHKGLVKCKRSSRQKRRGYKQRRRLVVSLRLSKAAKVRVTVTARLRKARGKKRGGRMRPSKDRRRSKSRTVLKRTVRVKGGANDVVLSLPAKATGRLWGEVSVVGASSSRKVKVRR